MTKLCQSSSLLTLLLFTGVQPSPLHLPCTNSQTSCGLSLVEPVSHRIIGGGEAPVGAWPWIVLLAELGFSACGGAIISEYYILTATHCFSGASNDPKRWQVLAGKHYLNRVDPGQQVVKVSQIILHDNFDNVSVANDIALLLLEEPLVFSDVIRPVCLPTADQGVTEGEVCVMAGWGSTQGTADQMVLNQVLLPIISDDICALSDWYGRDFIPGSTFCAGYEEGGKDGCTGDSGGSLICRRNGRWFSQGISSWGYSCAEYKWPGIYTDVSVYSTWITDKMKAYSNCLDVIG
ncbi:trypsin-1-like [Physella acuta]|uniref:trypsin-1-like n=1 Tax=Physella acuta TaxID=109671 RepID=UPI0027DDFE3A|nr:trypsin-1-like [Physella acuta]XP_059141388.1 trypsin-1-like [Physella acuta]